METPKHNGMSFMDRLRNGRLSTTFALLAVLTVGVLAGSVLTSKVSGMERQKADSSDARPLTIPDPVKLSNGFSSIVKQVGPAVVNINTESLPKQPKHGQRNGRRFQMPQNPNGDDGNGDDDDDSGGNDMQNFFNHFFGGQGAPDSGPRRALGSGFIVDPRGYIITNNHVVNGADHIYVKLSTDPDNDAENGRPATVVGTDKDTDIAVIKIDPAGLNLPVAKLGNSDGAEVGDWVLAIGSPFSLRQTVSAGIVSAKNRTIADASGPGGTSNSAFQKFIQTDAAINPGNSGGPLVNMAGQVIGMNTAIYTESAGSEGIGFAMPSNTIADVYNMLISPDHKVTRGSIGIQFQAAQSSAVGRMYGFANGGVLISVVTPNGPASKAGLQPGDVITTIDGTPIKDGDQLIAVISAKKPGSTVKIGYERNGKKQLADVGIADRAKLFADLNPNAQDDNAAPESDAGETKLGIKVQALTSAQAAKLNVHGGVMVTDVRPGSFADEIGLGKGAVIVEINKMPVTDEASYRNIVSGLKSGQDAVFVVRDPQRAGTGNSYVGGTLP